MINAIIVTRLPNTALVICKVSDKDSLLAEESLEKTVGNKLLAVVLFVARL